MPPRGVRIIGRALSVIATRAPWLWPFVRGFVHRFWNNMASGWSERVSPERTMAFEAGARSVPGAPRRILEVGTGTGSGAGVLGQVFPGAEISAVDLSEEMIRLAREAHPEVRFHVGDAASLPFGDGEFDLVAQLNVPVYSRELLRVLAPGGHVLIGSTFGPQTPYYTPHALLRRKFREVASGQAGPGDWFIGRRPS